MSQCRSQWELEKSSRILTRPPIAQATLTAYHYKTPIAFYKQVLKYHNDYTVYKMWYIVERSNWFYNLFNLVDVIGTTQWRWTLKIASHLDDGLWCSVARKQASKQQKMIRDRWLLQSWLGITIEVIQIRNEVFQQQHRVHLLPFFLPYLTNSSA